MSWQSYVDDQLLATKLVSKAAIAGHDGNIWATSEGFPATAAEIKVCSEPMLNTKLEKPARFRSFNCLILTV